MGITRIEFMKSSARFHIHEREADGAPDNDFVREISYDRDLALPPLESGIRRAEREYGLSWQSSIEIYWIPARGEAVAFLHGTYWENNMASGSSERVIGPYSVDQAASPAPPYRQIMTQDTESVLLAQVRDLYDEILFALARKSVRLYDLDSWQFERFVAGLFTRHGFIAELTKKTKDGGYDIVAVKRESLGTDLRVIIECKRNRPDRPVGLSVVRELWGVVTDPFLHFDRGIIATTSHLSKNARVQIETKYWRLQELDHEAIMTFAGFAKTDGGLWKRQ